MFAVALVSSDGDCLRFFSPSGGKCFLRRGENLFNGFVVKIPLLFVCLFLLMVPPAHRCSMSVREFVLYVDQRCSLVFVTMLHAPI